MEGKTVIHQRVLSRPGADLFEVPVDMASGLFENAEDIALKKNLPPFSAFYVFARAEYEGVAWVEVAAQASEPTSGWIKADDLIDWKQSMTVSFTNPVDRERVLLFRNRDELLDLIESPEIGAKLDLLHNTVQAGNIPEDFPVVSVEPSTHVDIRKQFYLLPILESEEVFLHSGFSARLLNVTSATLEAGDDELISDAAVRDRLVKLPVGKGQALAGFRSGITFVVDTTTSMGPYIDRTREAIRQIYDRIGAAGLLGEVNFGLVAFRDNATAAPGLEYVARVYALLSDGASPETFLDRISLVKPAATSSRDYREDAFAGVMAGIQDIDWSGFGGRFLVLVTDAPARTASDPLSFTGMNAREIRQLAEDRGIAIFVLHLLSPSGVDHENIASQQYGVLSEHAAAGALYFPVDAASVVEFGETVDLLSGLIVDQVEQARSDGAVADLGRENVSATAASDAREGHRSMRAKAAIVGRAMQLAYLGSKSGSRAPRVFDAWVSDRDLKAPEIAGLDVRLLLTKNQLNDLQSEVSRIVRAGKQALTESKDFFDQVRSAASVVARDPAQVGRKNSTRLADLGILAEYLEGLPYQSKVMSIDEEIWSSWSASEQQAFIEEIDSKLRLYEKYHDDVDRWVTLNDDAGTGDAVYPVPLEALP